MTRTDTYQYQLISDNHRRIYIFYPGELYCLRCCQCSYKLWIHSSFWYQWKYADDKVKYISVRVLSVIGKFFLAVSLYRHSIHILSCHRHELSDNRRFVTLACGDAPFLGLPLLAVDFRGDRTCITPVSRLWLSYCLMYVIIEVSLKARNTRLTNM